MPDESPAEPTRAYRAPDAILVDRDYPPDAVEIAKHQERNRLFGPVFGCARVQSGHSGAGFTRSLIRPADADTAQGRYHPQAHPQSGADRYDWFLARKQGSGKAARWVPVAPLMEGEPEPQGEILFGYLKPDPYTQSEAGQVATKKSLDERIAAMRDDEEFQERLAELQVDEPAPRRPMPPLVPEQSDKANTPIVTAPPQAKTPGKS